ncbi:MAG: phage holin family protein [Streptosporangiaceae bacterium]
MPGWAAALIAGGAPLIVAGITALLGTSQFGQATPAVPEQTVHSAKADVEEIKERADR